MDQIIKHISLHLVGNKSADERLVLSENLLSLDDELNEILCEYFLAPFSTDEYFQFFHNNSLNMNEVYSYVSAIFEDDAQLHEQSVNLAKHLYDKSTHPKIKGGEFYTVYFENCVVGGKVVDAVGLFKTENKDIFLKVKRQDQCFDLESEEGINLKKLDKGCLIFNDESDDGFIVAIVDNTNRGIEAQYWIDDFLQVRQRKDEYANTQNFMSLAKDFVTKEMPKEFEISKADQIDLLNRSLRFFKENESFDIDDFANEVIAQPDVIERFHQYKTDYERESDVLIDNQFNISEAACKKQQRSYKRIIRLDKKIQIVIDGNRENIEQGEDERGKYYKVYYSKED